MGLRLIIEDEEGATTIVPLAGEAVTIGRQEGNTIQLTEKNVSRQHARLEQHADGWVIEDLDSYNGVKVNGVSIGARVALQEGDVVQIGDYHLALSDDVEKQTLNIERPARAANSDEPLLVSSSANLPKLSNDELADLTAATAATAPLGDEVGTPPASPVDDFVEPVGRGGNKIGLIVGGVVLLGGGILLAMKLMGGAEPSPPVAQDTRAGDTGPAAAPEPAMEGGVSGREPAQVEPEPVAAADAKPDLVEPPPEASEPEIADTTPGTQRRSKKKKVPKTTKTTKKGASVKPPAAKPAPAPAPASSRKDGDQLLKDARKAQLKGKQSRAYALAKEALAAGKGSAALKVMGVAACKMGDAGKAKLAYKRLSGVNKEGLKKVCADKGIDL